MPFARVEPRSRARASAARRRARATSSTLDRAAEIDVAQHEEQRTLTAATRCEPTATELVGSTPGRVRLHHGLIGERVEQVQQRRHREDRSAAQPNRRPNAEQRKGQQERAEDVALVHARRQREKRERDQHRGFEERLRRRAPAGSARRSARWPRAPARRPTATSGRRRSRTAAAAPDRTARTAA